MADGRLEDALGSSAPEATVSAQNGSTYSGANHTQDGHIIQVGNINARHVQIGREAQSVNVLEWLYTPLYDSKHKKTRRERVEGSGTWLFERPEYQDWYRDTGPHRSLWCHGGPGAGKTFITSATVDKLLATHEDREVGIAYIYLDYADKEAQTLENVLASILKQIALCKKKEGIQEVQRLWCACKIDNRRAEAETLVETLGRMYRHFRQIFVVIDALDECSDELRKLLLKHLKALDDPRWRFFLTGRSHLSDVILKILPCLQVIVAAHNNDVEKAVLARIHHEDDLAELFEDSPSLEKKVVSKITEKANGMFLLVTLMLNSIATSTCESEIEESLDQMPLDLDQSYKKTLERIKDQDSKKVELSYRILWWLSEARRPLSCDELLQAIAVRDGDRGRNTKRESKKGIMIKACMGLVFMDDTGNFRLVHFSTQEYLRTHFKDLTINHIIAKVCLTILSYDEFEEGPCDTSAAAEKRSEKHPMLTYAASHWHEHLGESMTRELGSLAMVFLRSSAKVRAATQSRDLYPWSWRSRYEKSRMFAWDTAEELPQYHLKTGLHMAAELGLVYCVQELLGEPGVDINGTDDGYNTPLVLAMLSDHAKVVELLLRAETIDCEHEDNEGRTPLLLAALFDNTDVVKHLLAKGVNLQARDKEQWNALHIIAEFRDEIAQMVEILVAAGIDINARGIRNETPLHVAAQSGYCKKVEVLLLLGADVSAADQNGWTPLHQAAAEDLETAKVLHKAGADIHARDKTGRTVLHFAAKRGRLEIVEWLLLLGADVSAADKSGWTPLHGAAAEDLETAQVLHKAGADIHARNYDGYSVLYEAEKFGQRETVEWLLGADVHSVFSVEEAVCAGAAVGALRMLEILLRNRIDVNANEGLFGNALYAACEAGHEEVVRLLLDYGAATDQHGGLYGLPLSAAAFKGHCNVLQLLAGENPACVQLMDGLGRNALHLAARGGHLEAFDFLLSRGLDINKADVKGNTVLHYAAAGGSLQIVKRLLDHGVIKHTEAPGLWSPLHWAYRAGSHDVVDLLKNIYPVGNVVKTAQPAGLWAPLSIGLYHGNGEIEEFSLQPLTALDPQLELHNVGKGVMSNTLASCHSGYVCDECFFEIYGLRFHCCLCIDFDVCFMCKLTVAKSHPLHEWKVFEYKEGLSLEIRENALQHLLST